MIHDHLLNTAEFWLEYPVASYAKTEPDYYQGTHSECNWRGPTWAPTNYMIFQGLQAYGYHTEARELARRLFTMAVLKNPVLREYYNAETGDGLAGHALLGIHRALLRNAAGVLRELRCIQPGQAAAPADDAGTGCEFPELPKMWPTPSTT